VRTTGNEHRQPLRGEDLFLTLLCCAAGPLLWWLGGGGLAPEPGSGDLHTVERVVGSLCAGAGAVVAAWWFTALGGIVLAAVGHRWGSARLARYGHRLSPAFLRRVAASVLGVNLLLAPGAWADTPTPSWSAAAPSASSSPTSTPVRTPALTAASSIHAPAPASGHGTSGVVPEPTWKPAAPNPAVPGTTTTRERADEDLRGATVRRGDCLWDIAAEELGPYATELEIDRRWRQWYRQNQAVIGNDAHALVPGTVLQAPPLE
jgi:hypothetical protein